VPTRHAYEVAVLDERVDPLRTALRIHSPQFVTAYGERHEQQLRCLFSATSWGRVPTKRARIEIAAFNGGRSVAVTAPFLGNGEFSDDDAEAVIAVLRAGFKHARFSGHR
jgi:hypothetical protein